MKTNRQLRRLPTRCRALSREFREMARWASNNEAYEVGRKYAYVASGLYMLSIQPYCLVESEVTNMKQLLPADLLGLIRTRWPKARL